MRINVVNFNKKNKAYKNNEKEIGVIAQNIETEFPELILESYDANYGGKYKAVKYDLLGVLAIGALNELKIEQDIKINQLAEENSQLKMNYLS